ncbi:MAG: LysR family transcriptional regulator [Anaerolineales bacterium]|nr:MAG: LysR family transcriptional regulator [Anaerolineales bacterium]
MINLSDLKAFLVAAEAGSFSAAGRQLHLSQPAISQKIDSLEKRFGTRLFQRQGRTVQLTETGLTLKPIAQELLNASRRLEETMASLQGEVIGEMNLGCSTTAGKYLLPSMIARFRRKYPQVRINILVSSRDTVLNKLLAGEVALGVLSKHIEHRDIELQDFYIDDVVLIVAADHPWASFRQIYPDDLLEEPIIMPEELSGTRQVLLNGLREYDISPDMLNEAMTLGNAEAIVMAVAEGIGVAFVSRLAAARHLELGRVVEVQFSEMCLRRKIYMARNMRITATRAQTTWWEFVKSNTQEWAHISTIQQRT